MPLTQVQRVEKLKRWINPPTAAESQRLERAQRMVTQAVKEHPAFAGLGLAVGAKGSWANSTNVRFDSDVDIKVEFTQRVYRSVSPECMSWWEQHTTNAYSGRWTPKAFREELGIALKRVSRAVDATHNVAFYVPDVPGSRPSTDVVPCFTYLYAPGWGRGPAQGSVVFTRDGKHIVNWPQQQLDNGRAKNLRTNRRYKFAVRALKAVENDLAQMGVIKSLPSYFMECLIYNVPDNVLVATSLDQGFYGALTHLNHALNWWSGDYRSMVEPNEIKKVFGDSQKWTVDDARQLLTAAWSYLNYGNA